MSLKKKYRQAFTLIEIMVVVSIIALLMAVGVSSISTVQKKARDAKRRADLRDMKNALEQYYAVCGNQYPLPNGNTYDPVACDPGSGQIDILPNLPLDPKTNDPYYCPDVVDDNCNQNRFYLCADMETESSPQYCVSSLQ
ncbi:MAG: type II secretion system protein G, general secretion pathway protein G [Candidatus Gottesmanbacteria bacterium GW2011_GWA2_43_14]|uniref:Type II secretion system protein G, general secretion pathway protein G n=1 Tax=Candidatus Gottesmanbacteria bacterium GW2011_GWA2_43_14 TaxID=1618443 RepID=A0A0G1GCS4_9BACT|nr:MAG: type II secretion system protein G, general secretion pathway protein G [Candidatus Gottesmanbacteria bacterium GW2011_GWA2_43_14]